MSSGPSLLVDEPGRALVALRREGTRPTLYFLPGIFGNVVGYADFVRELGADQPIYGLQSIGLDGRAAPFASIEAMAGHYLMEIRAQQAQGPYALVGACFGATVAYEMARQLLTAGEILETQPPGPEVPEVANRSGIDWQEYWQGPLPIHVMTGKDSGDMLAGAHAARVARVLKERLRAAFEQSVNAASAAPARRTDASA